VIGPSDPRWLTDYAGKPTYMCRLEGYGPYNKYHLTGTNWNTTEKEIRDLCSKSDVLKEWHWQETINTSGMQSFWAEVCLSPPPPKSYTRTIFFPAKNSKLIFFSFLDNSSIPPFTPPIALRIT
jgi:hypothetical protein